MSQHTCRLHSSGVEKRGDRISNRYSKRVDCTGSDERRGQVPVPWEVRGASVRAGRSRWQTGGQGRSC